MKIKHLRYWIEQTINLSKLSECVRKKFGCLIVDPDTNCVLVNGYNGASRGGSRLCGGETCSRDLLEIQSGERTEVGCNHAEANAIANSARLGISVQDKWLFINGEPCLACAKLIHHAGINTVIYVNGGYSIKDGISYLVRNSVNIFPIDLKDDATLKSVLQPRFKEVSISKSPFQ